MKVKGWEITLKPVTNSFMRRTQQYENKIKELLKRAGVHEDDIELSEEKMPIKQVKAGVRWFMENETCYYSYRRAGKYVNNMQIVMKVLEQEVLKAEKNKNGFATKYAEETDVEKQRDKARQMLGVKPNCDDLEKITKKYKELAKKKHPDSGGSVKEFQTLNKAHKLLVRELE